MQCSWLNQLTNLMLTRQHVASLDWSTANSNLDSKAALRQVMFNGSKLDQGRQRQQGSQKTGSQMRCWARQIDRILGTDKKWIPQSSNTTRIFPYKTQKLAFALVTHWQTEQLWITLLLNVNFLSISAWLIIFLWLKYGMSFIPSIRILPDQKGIVAFCRGPLASRERTRPLLCTEMKHRRVQTQVSWLLLVQTFMFSPL